MNRPVLILITSKVRNGVSLAAGQTSYGFANMCGSELCRARRAAGLPALAVGWGPIANVGVMAESDKVQATLSHNLDKGFCCPHASPDGRITTAGRPSPAGLPMCPG